MKNLWRNSCLGTFFAYFLAASVNQHRKRIENISLKSLCDAIVSRSNAINKLYPSVHVLATRCEQAGLSFFSKNDSYLFASRH